LFITTCIEKYYTGPLKLHFKHYRNKAMKRNFELERMVCLN